VQEIIDNLLFQHSNTRKIVLLGVHITFLTSLEDYLGTKQTEFLYLGKNINSELAFNICAQFSSLSQYKVLIVDTS
jgi:hypothetical protein